MRRIAPSTTHEDFPISPADIFGTNEAWRRNWPARIAGVWIFVDLLLLRAGGVTNGSDPSEGWFAVVLGMVFAQLSYGGFWLVLGPGRAAVRIPLVLAGTAFASAAFFRQVVAHDELELRFILFFVLLLLLFQFCLIGLTTLFRWLLRWEVHWAGDIPRDNASQFGLRDILTWMAGVGILIVFFRDAFAEVNISNADHGDLIYDLVIAVILLTSTLAQAFLAGWASFGTSLKHRTLIGFVGSILLATGCAAPLGMSGDMAIVVLILFAQYAVLWSMLAWLRRQGLRLVPDQPLVFVDHAAPPQKLL